jgi:hypothetical protein
VSDKKLEAAMVLSICTVPGAFLLEQYAVGVWLALVSIACAGVLLASRWLKEGDRKPR